MKVALLIHAHIYPEQVARLVSRLRHPDVDIYINIDGKMDIGAFKNQIQDAYFLRNRVNVIWGRFSQTQQILNSYEEILSRKEQYSHILFISGLDYPVQPIAKTVNFLQNNRDTSFIDYHLLGDDDWSLLMKKRYEYWHFLPKHDLRNNQFVKKVLSKLGFKRKYPFAQPYYGACWFCLTSEVGRYLVDFTNKNRRIIKFFEHSGCSDELYIQSVLLNSPLKDKLQNVIYRFFDWSNNGKSPKILVEDDFQAIKASGAWFARKVDMNIDSRILDMLDELNSDLK